MCLLKFGFVEAFTYQIMNCVTSVHFQVKVIEFFTVSFPSYGGIRQGDPLSRYLYIFCNEATHCAFYSHRLRCPLVATHGNHIPLL